MKLGRESAYGIEGLLPLDKKPPGTVMLLTDIAASRGGSPEFSFEDLSEAYQVWGRPFVVGDNPRVRPDAHRRGESQRGLARASNQALMSPMCSLTTCREPVRCKSQRREISRSPILYKSQ